MWLRGELWVRPVGNRVCGGQGWRAGWADRASVGALARRGPDGRRGSEAGRPVGSDEPIRQGAPGCVAVGVDGATNRLAGSGIGYDANGNLTWDGVTGQGLRAYDGENRLVQAAGEGGGLWRYVYDADGRRVKLNVGRGDERWLVYGVDGAVVAEYALQGAGWQPVVEYGYRNGELLVIGEGWRCRWVVSDVVGSVRLSVDQTGSAVGVKRRDYMPYGEDLGAGVGGRSAALGYEAAVPSDPRKKYGTYERDDGTGLDYAQARYYQSRLGRFTSIDPLLASGRPEEPQTWNRYAYCLGNPVIYADRTGQAPHLAVGAVAVGAGLGFIAGGVVAFGFELYDQYKTKRYDNRRLVRRALAGGIGGAIGGGAAVVGPVSGVIGGAIGSVATGVINRYFDGKPQTIAGAVQDAAVGAVSAGIATGVNVLLFNQIFNRISSRFAYQAGQAESRATRYAAMKAAGFTDVFGDPVSPARIGFQEARAWEYASIASFLISKPFLEGHISTYTSSISSEIQPYIEALYRFEIGIDSKTDEIVYVVPINDRKNL